MPCWESDDLSGCCGRDSEEEECAEYLYEDFVADYCEKGKHSLDPSHKGQILRCYACRGWHCKNIRRKNPPLNGGNCQFNLHLIQLQSRHLFRRHWKILQNVTNAIKNRQLLRRSKQTSSKINPILLQQLHIWPNKAVPRILHQRLLKTNRINIFLNDRLLNDHGEHQSIRQILLNPRWQCPSRNTNQHRCRE